MAKEHDALRRRKAIKRSWINVLDDDDDCVCVVRGTISSGQQIQLREDPLSGGQTQTRFLGHMLCEKADICGMMNFGHTLPDSSPALPASNIRHQAPIRHHRQDRASSQEIADIGHHLKTILPGYLCWHPTTVRQ
jgi:hypothetical protein